MRKSSLFILATILVSLFMLSFSQSNTIDNANHYSPDPGLYSEKVDSFINAIETEYGDSYQDSLWSHMEEFQNDLIGVKFDNFTFLTVDGDEVDLNSFTTPIVFKATASWCPPCKAAVPALNALAGKYEDKVKFILVTHNTQQEARKFANGLDNEIIVIPSEEHINAMELIKVKSGKFKHIFSFPTYYFLNSNKVITNIKLGGPVPGTYPHPSGSGTMTTTAEDVFESNVNYHSYLIENLLSSEGK